MIHKNWAELIKPTQLDVKPGNDPARQATVIAEPLDRGFGLTLGNALRRVLMSSLQGAAITSIQIDNVLHEFSSVAGVREDVTDIVLNLKGVAIRMDVEGPKRLSISAKGPMVVTAGALTGKSPLKKVFDDSGDAICIGLYDDPPSRAEIEAELKRAGLKQISPEAMTDLGVLARALDPGDFRQTLEKIALYHWGQEAPLASADVAACAPGTIEAEVDDVIHAVAERDQRQVGALMRRLEGQGVAPVTLCIGALRHFRALHGAATDGGGAANGMVRMRVFGPRRDRMLRQLQGWRVATLEWALAELLETDLTLRSTSRAPAMAVMERCLIRLSMAPR